MLLFLTARLLGLSLKRGQKSGGQAFCPYVLGTRQPYALCDFWSFAWLIKHRRSYDSPAWHLPYLDNILLWQTMEVSCQVHQSKEKDFEQVLAHAL